MATYIAMKQVFDGSRLVEEGGEFEVDLLDGQNPPPADVAVPKTKSRKSKVTEEE